MKKLLHCLILASVMSMPLHGVLSEEDRGIKHQIISQNLATEVEIGAWVGDGYSMQEILQMAQERSRNSQQAASGSWDDVFRGATDDTIDTLVGALVSGIISQVRPVHANSANPNIITMAEVAHRLVDGRAEDQAIQVLSSLVRKFLLHNKHTNNPAVTGALAGATQGILESYFADNQLNINMLIDEFDLKKVYVDINLVADRLETTARKLRGQLPSVTRVAASMSQASSSTGALPMPTEWNAQQVKNARTVVEGYLDTIKDVESADEQHKLWVVICNGAFNLPEGQYYRYEDVRNMLAQRSITLQ